MADSDYAERLMAFAGWNEQHYDKIGKVAANWAVLEALVNSFLWVLAGADDEPGACLTAQIPSMPLRLNALLALVKLKGASERLVKRLNDFANDTHGLSEQRNRVVHDPWHVKKGQLNRLQITAKGILKFNYVPVAVSDIAAVVERIREHIDRFDALADEINSELGPLPGMQRKASP